MVSLTILNRCRNSLSETRVVPVETKTREEQFAVFVFTIIDIISHTTTKTTVETPFILQCELVRNDRMRYLPVA